MRVCVFGVMVSLMLAGCSAGRVASWEKGVDLNKKGDDAAAIAQGDAAFAERGDESKLRAALQAWEKAAELNPSNLATYVRLARGYYFLADGHLSFLADKDDAKKKELLETYEKGVAAAERGLVASSPAFAEKMRAKLKTKAAFAVLEKNSAPPLYWYAVNLGKWANVKGFAARVGNKDSFKGAVDRVLELDRDYFHGGADRSLGSYYSVLSPILGGDPKKSKEHFDRSLQVAPNCFATKVLMADFYYGKRVQNRAEFERTLKEVIQGNPNALPELAPENRVEQKKAEALLKKADDI